MSKKQQIMVSDALTKTIFKQINNEMTWQAEKTLDGNRDIIDFKMVYGLYKDNLLTAALTNSLESLALKLVKEFGDKINLDQLNDANEYALYIACLKGYKDVSLEILKRGGKNCGPAGEEGFTPFMYACVKTQMIEIVEYMIAHKICDIGYANKNGETALSLVLQVGNDPVLGLLLDSGKSNPGSILKDAGNITVLQRELYEGIKIPRLILEKTGIDCNPLYINEKEKFTSLLLAIPTVIDKESELDDYIYVVKMILDFAEEKKDINFVDYENEDGYSAFDLLFVYADHRDGEITFPILKLFIDYYYKNNPNSQAFLRNVDRICDDEGLKNTIKRIYSASEHKDFLNRICNDVIEAPAKLINPREVKQELPVGKRNSTLSEEGLNEAVEMPIVHAQRMEEDTGFNVSDPHVRGVFQTKPEYGGKKTKRQKNLLKKNRKTMKLKKHSKTKRVRKVNRKYIILY
jgi:ankyrin repeat protein